MTSDGSQSIDQFDAFADSIASPRQLTTGSWARRSSRCWVWVAAAAMLLPGCTKTASAAFEYYGINTDALHLSRCRNGQQDHSGPGN